MLCNTDESSGRLVGWMLAWMTCDVATHTEHLQRADPFENIAAGEERGKEGGGRVRGEEREG